MSTVFFSLFIVACQDSALKTFNSTPEANITSHQDGDEVLEGYPVTLRGAVSDPNHKNTDLLASWFVSQQEACPDLEPPEDGSVSCELTLAAGEQEILLEVQDPQGSASSTSININVIPTQAPTVAILSPVAEQNYYSDTLVNLKAMIDDEEDDISALISRWNSSIDGLLNEVDTTPQSSGEISGYASLSEGQHVIGLEVEDTTGKTTKEELVITVNGPNNPPSCGITSPEDGHVSTFGNAIVFEGTVADADIPVNELTIVWQSDQDGELGSGTVNSAGELSFSYDALSAATHTITLQVKDEVDAACSDFIIVRVGTPPMITIQQPIDAQVYTVGESLQFVAEVVDNEESPEGILLQWESNLAGVLSIDSPSADGIAQFTNALLPTGQHTLSVTATDSLGLSSQASLQFRINTAPTMPTVTIAPDPADTNDDLVGVAGGATDADGDPISYTYGWLQNGASTSYTTATVPASATAKGELWTLEAVANDGYVDGPTAQASLYIANTPPTLSAVAITPVTAYNYSTLSCTPTVIDPDETPAESYEWSNLSTGNLLATTATLSLDSSLASPDDIIQCAVTVTDSDNATASLSTTVTLANSTPTITSVTISPSVADFQTQLSCSVNASDADDDAMNVGYVWNNMTTNTQLGTSASLQLNLNLAGPGDVVRCAVTVQDIHGATAASSNTISISNNDPSIDALLITPNPATTDATLQCLTTITDAEDGALSPSYSWSNQLGVTLGTASTLSLDNQVVSPGDTLSCTVSANDSYGASISDVVTVDVENTPPIFSQAPAISAPNGLRVDQEISCSATAYDTDGDTPTVAYEWYNGASSIGSGNALTLTTSNATPGDTITCSVTATDLHGGTTVETASAVAENTPPALTSVTIGPDPAYTNDTLTVTATATDADGDTISFDYAWYVDQVLQNTNASTLDSQYFVKDQDIVVQVTPRDSLDSGTTMSTQTLTISNTPPSAPSSVEISPETAAVRGEIVCTASGQPTDIDGDTLTYSYTWYVNGIELTANNFNGSLSALTSNTMYTDALNASYGDVITCAGATSDGTDLSASVMSHNESVVSCFLSDHCDDVIMVNNILAMDLALVPAGSFTMGSASDVPGRDTDEDLHSVELTYDFWMSNYPLSYYIGWGLGDYGGEYCHHDNNFSILSDESVGLYYSWDDAAHLSNLLSADQGYDECYTCTWSYYMANYGSSQHSYGYCSSQIYVCEENPAYETIYDCPGYRIPTEAEWEYAAKAGNDSSFWGENGGGELPPGGDASCDDMLSLDDGTLLNDYATYCRQYIHPHPLLVQKQANGFGLHDMHGMVYEWTNDRYEASLGTDFQVNPTGPAAGSQRVLKSAPYNYGPGAMRSASRQGHDQDSRGIAYESYNKFFMWGSNGFRLVRRASNAYPSAPEVSISPDIPIAGQDNLLCNIDVDSQDGDGDTISYSFAWYVDGVLYAGNTSMTYYSDDTIPASVLQAGEQYHCVVTPNDGTDDGTVTTSTTIVVQ